VKGIKCQYNNSNFNCQISYEAQTWYTIQLYMLTEILVIKNILAYKGQCNNINGKRCTVNVWEVTLQKAKVLELIVHG